LIARSGLRPTGLIGYAGVCRSKMNFKHRRLDHFMQSPLHAAMVCILNSFNSSNVWQKAPIQTFRSPSKLPKDVDFRIEKRLRRPKTTRTTAARFGSQADICSARRHVRFAPNSDRKSGFPQNVMSAFTAESGHVRCNEQCPLWANSGHSVTRSPHRRERAPTAEMAAPC
jgi:hypothetical protein